MSYHITRSITRIVSAIILLTVYLFHVINKFKVGELTNDSLQSWGLVMIIFVGITIGLAIIVEIIFHILFSIGLAIKETVNKGEVDDLEIENRISQEMVEDEMAKFINLKALRTGYIVFGLGFMISLVILAFYYPGYIMLNILFVFFFIAVISEELARIYYYKRGI